MMAFAMLIINAKPKQIYVNCKVSTFFVCIKQVTLEGNINHSTF